MDDNETVQTKTSDLLIHRFLPQGECDWSGKSGESVEISAGDGSINQAVISIPQLTNLLRFRHRQGDKHQANGTSASVGTNHKTGAVQ